MTTVPDFLRARYIDALRFMETIRAPYRRHVLHRTLRRIRDLPHEAPIPGYLLDDVIYGWGHVSGSIKHEYATALLEQARTADGPILECGSGLSTILLGIVAQQRGIQVWSLEHSPFWASKVRSVLIAYGIKSVSLCEKPLRDYGAFTWYDPPKRTMPRDFKIVVCDGPPACGANQTPGGRYGLLPIMRDHLASGCVILLDDANRKAELEIIARWAEEVGSRFEVKGMEKQFGVLVVP